MNDTPASAAQYVLERVSKSAALNYAMTRAESDSIRGKAFWTSTAEIVSVAKQRGEPMYAGKSRSGIRGGAAIRAQFRGETE